MTVLAGHNLSKFYGPDEVFSGISVEVPPKSRIALVGPNGAGKTTLINLLIGADLPTEGTIQKARDARVSFLPQRPEMAGSHSIWEEQLKAFAGVREIEHEMNEWATLMADPKRHDEALERYSDLQHRFDLMGGYTYETKIRMVLTGVGFREEEYQTPLTQLSGGQKTRAMLCRLLLEEPDLLVLDEPTNHLDIYAVEWLEAFLSDFPGAVLVISHDRYFIDHFASTIWELDFGMIETYRGNYTSYTRQREERRERLQKEFDEQQEFIAKERDFIRKHMGSRWTAQAKGRLKKLNTMQKRGKIIERGPRDRLTMHLKMQESGRSGNQVVMTTNLTVGYSAPLVKVPDLLVLRGETVAIIGPNGAGKSTLLKTLIEQLAPIAGSVRLGANVKIGYFAQAHEGLDPNRTLLDEIFAVKMMPISEARNYLGAFMFSGDDVYRPVSSLSGGERGRVALAKLSLGGANLLLLDEPTNHLDIESQEILQGVLEDFNGAILLVSHDRYLIDRLATQIWDVRNGVAEVFGGTYQEFVTARNQKALAANGSANGSAKVDSRKKPGQVAEKVNGLNPFERKKRIATLEQEIERLEKKLHTINETLAKTSDAQRVIDLGHDYNATESALNIAVEEWGSLSE